MFSLIKQCFNSKFFALGLFALGLCLAPIQFAHAYVDPGTGSYILQITIGVIAGIAFAIKSFWGGIVSTIKGKRSVKAEAKEDKQKKEKTDK